MTLDNNGSVIISPHAERQGCSGGPFPQTLGLYQHACGSSLASLLVTEENILRVWGDLGCGSVP